jgi:hypothetical protein
LPWHRKGWLIYIKRRGRSSPFDQLRYFWLVKTGLLNVSLLC